MATDLKLQEGQRRIENEFWTQLPGKKDKPENKIHKWDYNSDLMRYTMPVEVDGKQGRCDFSDKDVRDCLADKTVQKRVKRQVKKLTKSLGL